MATGVPTPGDSRAVNGVEFVAITEEKFTARSEADTTGEDLIDVHLLKDGTLTAKPEVKTIAASDTDWARLAEMLKEESLDRLDRYREVVVQHRRDFDALPRFNGGRKVGNVVLIHTSDPKVVRARSVNDSDGSQTGVDVVYLQDLIHVAPAAYARNWDEAIERLAQVFDKYEADLVAAAERKDEFVGLGGS